MHRLFYTTPFGYQLVLTAICWVTNCHGTAPRKWPRIKPHRFVCCLKPLGSEKRRPNGASFNGSSCFKFFRIRNLKSCKHQAVNLWHTLILQTWDDFIMLCTCTRLSPKRVRHTKGGTHDWGFCESWRFRSLKKKCRIFPIVSSLLSGQWRAGIPNSWSMTIPNVYV